MIAIRPTNPENKKIVHDTEKRSFLSKIAFYTSNDQDFTPTLKIIKAPVPHKK
jgi:hypothetical protein